MARLGLHNVTLCAATSVNVAATLAALHACLEQVEFAECLLFTDAPLSDLDGITIVPIAPLCSAAAYSSFMIKDLGRHIRTGHCLVVQWDGFIIDAGRWDPAFLDCDYIGAPWPQFDDRHTVGNGGFSLRSKALLDACRDDRFILGGAEDIAICRTNRRLLEDEYSVRFADPDTAGRFAFERAPATQPSFGFHGIFNMIPLLGAEHFGHIYDGLDDRRTGVHDGSTLLRQLGLSSAAAKVGWRIVRDRIDTLFSRDRSARVG